MRRRPGASVLDEGRREIDDSGGRRVEEGFVGPHDKMI